MLSGVLKSFLSMMMATVVALTSGCTYTGFDSQANFDGQGCVMYFMDVGQADCCLISCDGEYMLIDAGNNDDEKAVVSYLKDNGIDTLKYAVATHPHEDHVGGLDYVLDNVDTQTVILPDCDHSSKDGKNLMKVIENNDIYKEYARVGEVYQLGKGSFEILGPTQIGSDMNGNSIVLRFDYSGVSAVFTGDAERTEELNMLDAGLLSDVDILKVGHHGSREGSSYAFLRELMPEYAVISCGKDNSYGHPHEESVSRIEDSGADIYRTDELGGIIISTDGKSIKVTTSDGEEEAPISENSQQDITVTYIGNINSKVYHTEDCTSLPAEKNRVYFNSAEDAQSQGYKPCGNCNP